MNVRKQKWVCECECVGVCDGGNEKESNCFSWLSNKCMEKIWWRPSVGQLANPEFPWAYQCQLFKGVLLLSKVLYLQQPHHIISQLSLKMLYPIVQLAMVHSVSFGKFFSSTFIIFVYSIIHFRLSATKYIIHTHRESNLWVKMNSNVNFDCIASFCGLSSNSDKNMHEIGIVFNIFKWSNTTKMDQTLIFGIIFSSFYFVYFLSIYFLYALKRISIKGSWQ